MAEAKLAIHIPEDADSARLSEVVRVIARSGNPSFESAREFREFLADRGAHSRQEIPPMAVGIGLLMRDESGLRLSEIGTSLAKIDREIVPDLIHYLFYSAWRDATPLTFLPSWTYRQICGRYWALGEVALTPSFKKRTVGAVNEAASAFFAQYGSFPDPSFSTKSLRGMERWLLGLRPPVLDDKTFRRRAFCPPELVVLALGFSVRDEPYSVGVDVLLTRERRETICQLCLLAPEALDQVLDYALASFPALIQPGTSAGFYGRFIRLLKLPTLKDVAR